MPLADRLTCFLVPKPFLGHIGLIQENTLRCLAAHGIPTLVMGDEVGVAEACAAYGIRHLPDLLRNEAGTPRVDGAFAVARRTTGTPHLCYLNADILLPQGFPEHLLSLLDQAPQALLTGRRWDLAVEDSLAFDADGWAALEERRGRDAHSPGPSAMDYFVFPRDAFLDMPPFAVGRPGWDNWMVYQARTEGLLVVDLSPMLAVVHQGHDFNHLPGGEETYRNGAESLANRHMAGGYFHLFCLEDATHIAVGGRVRRRWWRLSTRMLSRWGMGLTTGLPWLRECLCSLKGCMRRGDR